MAKRRLIKKINEVSEEELAQETTLNGETEVVQETVTTTSNSALIEEQTQEIKRLRELIEEYRIQETEFEQSKEEAFRLSQQNKQLVFKVESGQEELEELRAKNDLLATQLDQKETEIFELEDANELATTDEEVQQLTAQIDALKKKMLQVKNKLLI